MTQMLFKVIIRMILIWFRHNTNITHDRFRIPSFEIHIDISEPSIYFLHSIKTEQCWSYHGEANDSLTISNSGGEGKITEEEFEVAKASGAIVGCVGVPVPKEKIQDSDPIDQATWGVWKHHQENMSMKCVTPQSRLTNL